MYYVQHSRLNIASRSDPRVFPCRVFLFLLLLLLHLVILPCLVFRHRYLFFLGLLRLVLPTNSLSANRSTSVLLATYTADTSWYGLPRSFWLWRL